MKNFTLRNFNSALKTVNAQADTMQVIAGYVIQQAMLHSNLDAAKRALTSPAFIDQRNGRPNTLGTQLKNYLVAHCRMLQIKFDKDQNAPIIKLKSKFTGEEKNFLVDIAASRKKGERVYQAEPVQDIGFVLIDFKQFVEFSAPAKDKVQAPFTVAQINTRLETLSTAISERGIVALPAELEQSLKAIDALRAELLKQVAASTAPNIETSQLDQLDKVKPSSASKAANLKQVG